MQKLKTHIGYKISLIVLIIALLVPSFVKLAHAFENHKHEVCKTPQKSHYHELDLDCEFYKFNKSNITFITPNYGLDIIENSSLNGLIYGLYNFKYYHQHLSFSLRAPPSFLS